MAKGHCKIDAGIKTIPAKVFFTGPVVDDAGVYGSQTDSFSYFVTL